MYKPVYRLGLAAYIMLFVFAIVCYKERTVFLDISFLLYSIMKNDELAIQVYRFGAAFTQVFPLIGRRLNMSLQHIMILYSAGVAFYYFVCYLLCGRVFKRYDIAIGLLLFNILFVTNTFFWMQAELPLGVATLFVMYAFLHSELAMKNMVVTYILATAMAVTVSFFHPLLFIPSLYIFLYHRKEWKERKRGLLFLFAAIVFVASELVKAKWFGNPYDSTATSQSKNIKHFFPNYWDLYATQTFVKDWLGKFVWIPITSLLVIVYAIIKKRWIDLALFLSFFVGYTILICASYPTEKTEPFYIENLFLPLAIIIGVPFIFIVMPQLNKKLAVGLFALIIVMGGTRIYSKRSFYTSRVDWMRGFMEEHKGKKLLVNPDRVPMQTLLMTWGSSYEFWLLSTAENNETASIIVDENYKSMLTSHWDTRMFRTKWDYAIYDDLPEPYFIFKDTTTAYVILE